MTHAFFKALLFLGAGVVILAMHEEHDIFKMGGLRRSLPLTFWTFLIGAASLAALPLVTAGFYSKDLIIAESLISANGSPWLWAAGLLGALITSLYTFRMVFVTFFGDAKQELHYRPQLPVQVPLVILAGLSIVGGLFAVPEFLRPVLPETAIVPALANSAVLSQIATGLMFLIGLGAAYIFFVRAPQWAAYLTQNPVGSLAHRFWFAGWGFDGLYDTLLVRPFVWLAHVDRDDWVDLIYTGLAALGRVLYRALSRTETGQVRWYAMGIGLGAVITIAVAVFLWY